MVQDGRLPWRPLEVVAVGVRCCVILSHVGVLRAVVYWIRGIRLSRQVLWFLALQNQLERLAVVGKAVLQPVVPGDRLCVNVCTGRGVWQVLWQSKLDCARNTASQGHCQTVRQIIVAFRDGIN